MPPINMMAALIPTTMKNVRAHLMLGLYAAGALLAFAVVFIILFKLMTTLSAPDNTNMLDGDVHIKGRVYADGGFHTGSTTNGSSATAVSSINITRPDNLTTGELLVWRPDNGYINVGNELESLRQHIEQLQANRRQQKLALDTCLSKLDTRKAGGDRDALESRLNFVEGLVVCFMLSDPEMFDFPKRLLAP
jgi:hypothetical protein